MRRRQTSFPHRWLVIDGAAQWPNWLPAGTGIFVVNGRASARLRRLARMRGVTLLDEGSGEVARVHDMSELRRALLRRTAVILLSPIRPTTSHPGWKPMPPMRAAALAQLAGRRLFALGGMDEERFRRVEPLGFLGWAGISAFARESVLPAARASRRGFVKT